MPAKITTPAFISVFRSPRFYQESALIMRKQKTLCVVCHSAWPVNSIIKIVETSLTKYHTMTCSVCIFVNDTLHVSVLVLLPLSLYFYICCVWYCSIPFKASLSRYKFSCKFWIRRFAYARKNYHTRIHICIQITKVLPRKCLDHA